MILHNKNKAWIRAATGGFIVSVPDNHGIYEREIVCASFDDAVRAIGRAMDRDGLATDPFVVAISKKRAESVREAVLLVDATEPRPPLDADDDIDDDDDTEDL